MEDGSGDGMSVRRASRLLSQRDEDLAVAREIEAEGASLLEGADGGR